MVRPMASWGIMLAFYFMLSLVETREIVCYYGTWATYRKTNGKFTVDNVDPFLCTQLNYAFFDINPNGTVRIIDEYVALPPGPPVYGLDAIAKFNNLKQKNPALKTIASVGGYNAGMANFSTVAASAQLRATFASNAVAFLQKYRFDGMDIDWEYPVLADKANFVLLLKELANAFAPYKLLLTVAVAATESTSNNAYDISAISSVVHYINLMEYVMQGNYGVTRHHAPLYVGPTTVDDTSYKRQLNVEASVKYWLNKGAPAAKLILGIPFFEKTFKLTNSTVDGVGAPTNGVGTEGPYTKLAGALAYYEICQRPWTWNQFDPVQNAAYASGNGDWVFYDNVNSIALKCNLIAKYGLGGGMVRSIESDDFLGVCGTKFELLTALNKCVNI